MSPPGDAPPTREPLPYRLAAALENWAGADAAVDAVSARVGRLPKPVRDALHGRQVGHPLHPLLVLVPTGAWLSAAFLDAVRAPRAARSLIGLGLLSATPAVAAGLVDWSSLRRDQQRVGAVHAVTNATAWTFYLASWARRRRGRGVLLSLIGLALVSTGGYLGGHLTYRQAAGVESRPDLPR